MSALNLTSIKKEFVVEASQQIAFEVFIQKMDHWWPRTHRIGSSELMEVIVETQVNGRWYTRHADGSEATIGYVQRYEPYDLVVLAWQISGEFKCDPNLVTDVVARFIPQGPKTTRVEFEHKDLDKLGGGKTVESMNEGWGMILKLYKQATEK